MAYASVDEFVAYAGSEIIADRPFFADVLAAAKSAIEAKCGRSFDTPTGAATTRTYSPDRRTGRVRIHDLASTVGLTVADNGTAVTAADLQFEPVGNRALSGEWAPYSSARRVAGYWASPSFTSQATVALTTDQWGWLTTPAAVKQAQLILAKDLAHLRQNRFGVVGFGDLGGVVRVRENPHVEMLLAPYKRGGNLLVA